MKIKTLLSLMFISAMLFLTACGPSIEEKKQQFQTQTLTPLKEEGYRLIEKEEGKEKTRYLLRLEKGEKVANFLLKSALGSSDPKLRQRLARGLEGTGLELQVDWQRYLKAKPGSVVAHLLPKAGMADTPVAQLLKARKMGGDLQFDEKGHLKKIVFHPLDETLRQGSKTFHIQLQGTELVVARSGESTYDQAYTFRSEVFDLRREKKGERSGVKIRKFHCDADTRNAYFGKRNCSMGSLSTDFESVNDRTKVGIAVSTLSGRSETRPKDGEVLSHATVEIGDLSLQEDTPAEKGETKIRGIRFEGHASRIEEELYRRLADLLTDPPASPKLTAKALMPLLADLFQKLSLEYKVEVAGLDFSLTKNDSGKKSQLNLQGFRYGLDGEFAADLNLTKKLEISQMKVVESGKGTLPREVEIAGFSVGVRLGGLYNFLPDAMQLALKSTLAQDVAAKKALRKEGEALGERMLQKGVRVTIDPLKVAKFFFKDSKMQKGFEAMNLHLDARLKPNQLDPRNPMAMMLLIAYLEADGKATMGKKDLEQILVELDPGMRMMVKQYVKYEGDRAVFDLHFEQGNLLINGKPLR